MSVPYGGVEGFQQTPLKASSQEIHPTEKYPVYATDLNTSFVNKLNNLCIFELSKAFD